MSQTVNDTCPVLTTIFRPSEYQDYSSQYQKQYLTVGLLGGLQGVLTILSIISIYTLLNTRSGRIQPTAVFLCLTILSLFTSTTIYVVTAINYYHTKLLNDFTTAAYIFWAYELPPGCSLSWPGRPDVLTPLIQDISTLGCSSAGSLTVNVTLGDAIVCWRACVVWHKNRVVKALCGAFVVTTFILGVIDTKQSCQSLRSYESSSIGIDLPGGLFEGIPVGIATCALSLSTNIFATILVACKAWQSRRRLKGYLAAKVGGSQVEKLLTLLIESGAIYSGIWAVVVAYQIDHYLESNLLKVPSHETANFVNYFVIIMNGGLVPLIAIYPTVIIVLVTLNRSLVERGISQHLESVPTPHLAMALSTTHASIRESQAHRTSEILVIGGRDSLCGDILEFEGERGRTCEEWEAQEMADAGFLLDR